MTDQDRPMAETDAEVEAPERVWIDSPTGAYERPCISYMELPREDGWTGYHRDDLCGVDAATRNAVLDEAIDAVRNAVLETKQHLIVQRLEAMKAPAAPEDAKCSNKYCTDGWVDHEVGTQDGRESYVEQVPCQVCGVHVDPEPFELSGFCEVDDCSHCTMPLCDCDCHDNGGSDVDIDGKNYQEMLDDWKGD